MSYFIKVGRLVRPTACESCGVTGKRIEAAHFSYDEPLRVRWLCRSCHVRWDKESPKCGTFVVYQWQSRTGRNAERAVCGGEKSSAAPKKKKVDPATAAS